MMQVAPLWDSQKSLTAWFLQKAFCVFCLNPYKTSWMCSTDSNGWFFCKCSKCVVQNTERAHKYIMKKAFLKMSAMLLHKLDGVTFLHSTAKHKFLLSHSAVSGCLLRQQRREGRGTRKYTQRGTKKVVDEINWSVFAIVVLSTRSTVPSIASSRTQEWKKKTCKRDTFLNRRY